MNGDVAGVKKCLAQKQIDVNAAVVYRRQPIQPALLHLLSRNCRATDQTKCEIATLLVLAGARPDLGNTCSYGLTALHTSCSAAMLQILLAANPPPNVNVRNKFGRTPLHEHAATNGRQCQLLIDAKAEVDTTAGAGNTALMTAVAYGCESSVSVLLAAGADITIMNKAGKTASTIAPIDPREQGTAKCKELIRKHTDVSHSPSRVRSLSSCRLTLVVQCPRLMQRQRPRRR